MLYLTPIALLFCSNVFMTFAWYGQLKFPNAVLWQVILVSWGIAFFEYCLAVPANRVGHQVYSAAQLKTLQEIITLLVFGVFSVLYLGETLKWNHMIAFVFLCGAAFFSFNKWSGLGRLPLERNWGTIMRALFTAAIAASLTLPALPAWAQARPDQQRFRALFKELIETNTTLSAGDCTLAAQKMAAHLNSAGY